MIVNITWGFVSKLDRLYNKKYYNTTEGFQQHRFQNYIKIGSVLHKIFFRNIKSHSIC